MKGRTVLFACLLLTTVAASGCSEVAGVADTLTTSATGPVRTPVPTVRSAQTVPGPQTTPAPTPAPGPDTSGDPVPTTNGASGRPSWVVPGVRITWYQAAASVAQSSFTWVEDPSGPYVDEKTGTHYRRTDESGEGQGAGGGEGVGQLDVLGVDGDSVAWTDTTYGLDRQSGTWSGGQSVGGISTGGEAPLGSWADPAALAGLQNTAAAGLLVLKGAYPLNDKTYQTVSLVNPDQSAYSSYTYDLDSGVLLSATTSTQGAGSSVAAPGQAAPAGNTQLTITRFVSMRERAIPGLGGSDPSWTGSASTLNYTGSFQFVNPADPSSAATTFGASQSVTLTPTPGSAWAQFSSTLTTELPGSQAGTSTGIAGPTGPYWIDPAALAELKAGSTIDTDPVTQQVETVESVGSSSVVIDLELKGLSSRNEFDLSTGVLTGYILKIPTSGSTYQLQLQR